MAAPRGRSRYQPSPGQTEGLDAPERWSKRKPEKVSSRGVRIQRVFVVLVVPVLLMLGSVYVHTTATGLQRDVVRLEEEKVRSGSEGERLEVRITELSEPGRIRDLAREKLGMRNPGKDLETYGSDGEDAVYGGEEKSKETGE